MRGGGAVPPPTREEATARSCHLVYFRSIPGLLPADLVLTSGVGFHAISGIMGTLFNEHRRFYMKHIKTIIFVVALLGSVPILITLVQEEWVRSFRSALCNQYNYSICMNAVNLLTALTLPFAALLPFSLITYPMRDAIFRPWFHFAIGWIPLSMVLIAITPESQGSDWMDHIERDTVAFFLSALFTLISTIIITFIWRRHRKTPFLLQPNAS